MNEDFWKALVNGLTPDSPKQANYWWKIPLAFVIVYLLMATIK